MPASLFYTCSSFLILLLFNHLCSLITSQTGPQGYIYYISTEEGLTAHYQYLEHAWNAASSVNRGIIAVSFESGHYPGQLVNMCDIFRLPNSIICDDTSSKHIFKKHDCLYTETAKYRPSSLNRTYFNDSNMTSINETWAVPMRHGWPSDLKRSTNFNYKDVECIAGVTFPNIGIYPKTKYQSMTIPPYFQKRYLHLLPLIKEVLGIKEGIPYATVHWYALM